MIILKEQLTAQDIKVIPREYEADKITITGVEGSTDYIITPTIDSYYLVFNDVYALKEGQQYSLVIWNGTEEVYRDRIFCTNQDTEDYTINKDEYIQTESNNDFIIV